jgi:hypothetical protein
MNRREFFTDTLGGLSGLFAVKSLNRSTDSFTIEVHQTDELTRWLSNTPNKEPKDAIRITRDVVKSVFDGSFSLNFEVLEGDINVAKEVSDPGFDTNLARYNSLLNWISNSPETTADIQILLSYYPTKTTGIASPAVLPESLKPLKPHGIVWGGFYNRGHQHFRRSLAHEVGHSVGMHHHYGVNFDDGTRSLMHRNSFANKFPQNYFGQEIQPGGKRVTRINPRVEKRHLNI